MGIDSRLAIVFSQLNIESSLNRRAIGGMAKSPMKHGKPIMGLLHWPYGETRMLGVSRDPWWALCFSKFPSGLLVS